MMPTVFFTSFPTEIEAARSPELRRMARFNRAHREEVSSLFSALTPRKLRRFRRSI